MANKPLWARTARDRALAALQKHHDAGGTVTPALIRQHARNACYSERHLRRVWKARLSGPADTATNQGNVLDDLTIYTSVYLACGVIARAYEYVKESKPDLPIPSLSTFRRRVAASWAPTRSPMPRSEAKASATPRCI